IAVNQLNTHAYPMVSGQTRLQRRFYEEEPVISAITATISKRIAAAEAEELGLITYALDSLDWDDEIRLALEERSALSPDSLTGLEANLRFGPVESMETRIFGRLSA